MTIRTQGAGFGGNDIHFCGKYTQDAPSPPVVETVSFGPGPQIANAAFFGTLFVGQRLNSTITSGSASMYLLNVSFDSHGLLSAAYIGALVGSVGPGSLPAITVANLSITSFNITINNGSLFGALTGYWHLRGCMVPPDYIT